MFITIGKQEIEKTINLISNEWMLISAGDQTDYNMMTASWGGIGHLWNKNVAFIFVRENRYTNEFLQKNDVITLSFFDNQYKDILTFCGTNSGRDVNKKNVGLTPIFTEKGGVIYEEARLIIEGKKLYSGKLDPENILDENIRTKLYDENQKNHIIYILEIENIIENNLL